MKTGTLSININSLRELSTITYQRSILKSFPNVRHLNLKNVEKY